MAELAALRRDRQRALADSNEEAHQRELSDTRTRRVAAQTKAAEISAARSAAKLAEERADQATIAVTQRESLIAELGPLEVEIGGLAAKFDEAEKRRAEAKSQVDFAEEKLVQLRQQQRENGARRRRSERICSARGTAEEIEHHQDIIAKAAELRSEVGRLFKAVGADPATGENVSRADDASGTPGRPCGPRCRRHDGLVRS